MLPEYLELEVAGLVGVVRIDDHPILTFARSVGEQIDLADDGLGGGVGQSAVDEVVEHVEHDERRLH